jgi:hypothetical protein
MTRRIRSVMTESEGRYRVRLDDGDRGEPTSFLFEIEEGEIQLVKWEPEFASYMNQNVGLAAPLFEAVLAFHRAQHLRLPSS